MGDKARNKRRKTLTPQEFEANREKERQRQRERRMRIKSMNDGGATNSTTIEDENIEDTMVVDEANLQGVNLEKNMIIQTSPTMSSNPSLNAMENVSIYTNLGTSSNPHVSEMVNLYVEVLQDVGLNDVDIDYIQRDETFI